MSQECASQLRRALHYLRDYREFMQDQTEIDKEAADLIEEVGAVIISIQVTLDELDSINSGTYPC